MPLFSAREMLFADLKFNGFSHRQWFSKKKEKKKSGGRLSASMSINGINSQKKV